MGPIPYNITVLSRFCTAKRTLVATVTMRITVAAGEENHENHVMRYSHMAYVPIY